MIFDSSTWINYAVGKINEETELLDRFLLQGIQCYICPTILQEILQGIKNQKDYEQTKSILYEMEFLQLDPYLAAEEASSIYRLLRAKGLTIRKPNDCLIAFYAIHFNITLVHNDKDFDKIAKHTKLNVYKKKNWSAG